MSIALRSQCSTDRQMAQGQGMIMESRAGIPLAALLFFDCLQLVYRRLLALHQRGCRGRKVALDRPWQRWAIRSVLELGV